MKIFVTGAAGFIGRAVVDELINHGHQVLGLVRSDAAAETVKQAGGEPHRGSLENLESLKSGAKASDGVIHLAFVHDFNDFKNATKADRDAIQTMADAMEGTGKPLVIAGGTSMVWTPELATEDTEPTRKDAMSDRFLSEDLVLSLSKEKNIRGSVIRLPPTVHGKGDKGVIPIFTRIAKESGSVRYVDEGNGRWPAVHRLDAAVLFRLAVEKGAAGARYHAVDDEAVKIKDVMELIGKHTGLPLESKTADEVKDLGFMGLFLVMDNPTSSEKTRRELGWKPTQPKLLEDLVTNYFL